MLFGGVSATLGWQWNPYCSPLGSLAQLELALKWVLNMWLPVIIRLTYSTPLKRPPYLLDKQPESLWWKISSKNFGLQLLLSFLRNSHSYCRDKPKFGGPGKRKQACVYVTLYVMYMIQHVLLALWNVGLCHRYRECQKLKYTSKKPSTVSKSCMYMHAVNSIMHYVYVMGFLMITPKV